MKYKVGDRVRITTDKTRAPYHWNRNGKMDKWLGKVMTIRIVYDGFYIMYEDFKEGYYWAWFEDMIDGLAEDESLNYRINIESDGKTTKAIMTIDGKEIKTGTAKCSPEDRFNFKIGAELALKRMWRGVKKRS